MDFFKNDDDKGGTYLPTPSQWWRNDDGKEGTYLPTLQIAENNIT